ncbi:M6 family metalloprotease domain-containing protein [Spirochaetia bacterium 38H-sp]|uniref:M6 family metalloprotease domain-containing protein n=1 Tax=Rarispira pelagica TaxID=3141764 RepID=A0ABU9UDK0_9SPIR
MRNIRILFIAALFLSFVRLYAIMPPINGGETRQLPSSKTDTPYITGEQPARVANSGTGGLPTKGTVKIPVLVVSYSDQAISSVPTIQSAFTSVTNYYSDMSGGKLIINFDIISGITLSAAHDTYGTNQTYKGQLLDTYAGTMVIESMLAADSAIDFSQYDNNGDGSLDVVVVIHPGTGEENGSSTDIWSHHWNIATATQIEYDWDAANGDILLNQLTDPGYSDSDNDFRPEFDGVESDFYILVPEYSGGGTSTTIGVYAHELGHALGLPDLYDTSNLTDGVGDWSLMGHGAWLGITPGDTPAPLDPWSLDFLGWGNVVTVDFASFMPFFTGLSPLIVAAIVMLFFMLMVYWFFIHRKLSVFVIGFALIFIPVSCAVIPLAKALDLPDYLSSLTVVKVPLHDAQNMEYLYLANYSKVNSTTWDDYLPGKGILAIHTDNELINQSYLSYNVVNNTYVNDGKMGVKVIEADENSELMTAGGTRGEITDLFASPDYPDIIAIELNEDWISPITVRNISSPDSTMSLEIYN